MKNILVGVIGLLAVFDFEYMLLNCKYGLAITFSVVGILWVSYWFGKLLRDIGREIINEEI